MKGRKCERCNGRGWIAGKPGLSTWPEKCPVCGGRGYHSFASLSRYFKCSRSTIKRYLDPERRTKMRPRTIERIQKLLEEGAIVL
jgi:DnaJ-class molecular chaperone